MSTATITGASAKGTRRGRPAGQPSRKTVSQRLWFAFLKAKGLGREEIAAIGAPRKFDTVDVRTVDNGLAEVATYDGGFLRRTFAPR